MMSSMSSTTKLGVQSMRIAWVSYGFLEYSLAHANMMADSNDVLLMLPEEKEDSIELQISNRIDYRPFKKPRLRQPLRQWFSIRSLLKNIDEFRPDIVHLQQGHLWFNFALRSLRRKYPVVITIHDPRYHAGDIESQKTPQWITDYGFRQADHIIVHGKALATQVQSLFGTPSDRLHVIPHISICAKPTEMQMVPEEPKNVLFFGRIWEYKGLDYLIEAEPLITARHPDVKIVIAGQGEDFSKYQSKMTHPERFEVLNRWISPEEQASLFQRASIVVLPYTEATQSGVVPVAYEFGKPVVATSVGALPECVTDGTTGLLVPPRDSASLAKAIIALLEDPGRRHAMGEAGRTWLESVAAPRPVVDATLQTYLQAIESRRI